MASRVSSLGTRARRRSSSNYSRHESHDPMVSLIVCTRNRAAKLRRLLQAFHSLEMPSGSRVEFIVVDNGSTDETPQVCKTAEEMFNGRMRCFFSAEPGVGHARNLGMAHARGDIFAFIDDDVVPKHDWLTVICQQFAADAELALLSGQVQLYDPLDLPLTIRTSTTRRRFDSIADAFSLLAGCNFAVRRQYVEKVRGFDSHFGAGTPFPVEDSDFFYRVWRAEGKLIYEPSMFVWHDHGRRSTADKCALVRGYMIGRGAFYSKHVFARDKSVLQACYWELTGLVKALFRGTSNYGWPSLGWLLRGFGSHALTCAWRSRRPRPALAPSRPAFPAAGTAEYL
jgi:glycosyltransferase involved in cell wall biosynthesis